MQQGPPDTVIGPPISVLRLIFFLASQHFHFLLLAPHPPEIPPELGKFSHACEGEMVYKMVETDKVPKFNHPVYTHDKVEVGKVDEIFGSTTEPVSVPPLVDSRESRERERLPSHPIRTTTMTVLHGEAKSRLRGRQLQVRRFHLYGRFFSAQQGDVPR